MREILTTASFESWPPPSLRRGRVWTITTMNLKETLSQLEALGTDKMRAQNAKNGAGENQFGVAALRSARVAVAGSSRARAACR